MTNGEIHLASRQPEPPENSDFAIYIDFNRGAPNPQRVFQSADAFIRGLQKLDRTLCSSIDSNIRPILVLEDIQTGSLKIWLKNILEATDDEAIHTLDWKPLVGKYLLKAKYAYIEWASKGTERPQSLVELSRKIHQIAQETDVKRMRDYQPPAIQDLVAVTNDIEAAKGYLAEGDKLRYISGNGETIDFDLTVGWTSDELSDLATKETVRFPPAPMILAVKKPDYLGHSRWEFRHGRKSISAKIEDEEWLSQFQQRGIDVRPGDALRCMVGIEHGYGYDNELVIEKYVITEVSDVLVNQYKQRDFFD